MNETERLDSLPSGNLRIWQDEKEFSFTTDAVFLAAFPHMVKKACVLELGCGTGAISLLAANRGAQSVLAVDKNPHVIELLKRSVAFSLIAWGQARILVSGTPTWFTPSS